MGYAKYGGSWSCAECPDGSVPSDDQASCEDCPIGKTSSFGSSICDRIAWWVFFLISLSVVVLFGLGALLALYVKKRLDKARDAPCEETHKRLPVRQTPKFNPTFPKRKLTL